VTIVDIIPSIPKSGAPNVQVTVHGSKAAANLPVYARVNTRLQDSSDGVMVL
jgi:hypothetical protein